MGSKTNYKTGNFDKSYFEGRKTYAEDRWNSQSRRGRKRTALQSITKAKQNEENPPKRQRTSTTTQTNKKKTKFTHKKRRNKSHHEQKEDKKVQEQSAEETELEQERMAYMDLAKDYVEQLENKKELDHDD